MFLRFGMLISRLRSKHTAYFVRQYVCPIFGGSKFNTHKLLRINKMDENVDSRDLSEKRPMFGNRHLTDEKNVFEHNAWDNVVWDSDQEEEARQKAEEQLKHQLDKEKQDELEENADRYWDVFYGEHKNKFFKDRQWLFTEFPELSLNRSAHKDVSIEGNKIAVSNKEDNLNSEEKPGISDKAEEGKQDMCTNSDGTTDDAEVVKESFPGERSTVRIWEVGCGVGNTVYPILQTNDDPGLMVYCCDFSSTAINIVKEHPDYSARRCTPFVCDISSETSTIPFPENTVDVIILIFVLSAIHPDKMQYVINRLASYLKPGGTLVFRDYGRYDMAQLRFKKGHCISENFYMRGDGTRVYFFTQDEVRSLCTKAGLTETQNLVDRRLQVNRGRQIKMYRVWIQCKYTKPGSVSDIRGDNSQDANQDKGENQVQER